MFTSPFPRWMSSNHAPGCPRHSVRRHNGNVGEDEVPRPAAPFTAFKTAWKRICLHLWSGTHLAARPLPWHFAVRRQRSLCHLLLKLIWNEKAWLAELGAIQRELTHKPALQQLRSWSISSKSTIMMLHTTSRAPETLNAALGQSCFLPSKAVSWENSILSLSYSVILLHSVSQSAEIHQINVDAFQVNGLNS